MKYSIRLFLLFITFLATELESSAANPVVRFHTDLGDIDVVLLENIAPATVANFLGYVNRKDYDNTFFHRSPPNFVVQGGGFSFLNGSVNAVPQQPSILNEFNVSNIRGTLAMAKQSGDPDSATSQWFFNVSNNSSNLDTQNGGFTVFGRVIGSSGLATIDAIAAVPIFNAGAPFDQIPLMNFAGGAIQDENLVHLISVAVIPSLEIEKIAGGNIRLVVTGAPSTSYDVQSSPTLQMGSFSPFTTLNTDADGTATFDHTISDSRQFFRVKIP